MEGMTEPDPHAAHLRARHRPAHARRRADRFAAFLLAELEPGMRLLDIGSGPGTITEGLATAVHPAVAVGIDFDPTPAEGTEVTVATADANHLPFASATFDAVFACAVLQHVDDPGALLAEARRVCRPGAIIGVADADWDGYVVHPPDPLLLRGQEVLAAIRPKGDPRVGKRLRELLGTAGFVDVTASARATRRGWPWDGRRRRVPSRRLRGPDGRGPGDVAGSVDRGRDGGDRGGLAPVGVVPGAFFASFWIEAIGRAPAEGQR